eukprot:CAMPEP_0177634394 /NCGR_PEP_ID=MMETSP0447-20121125/3346_1 /TAXON_ID=0 /ORGANISM="Stygamoeba regulata, Strain BSH-02190019" /LENGTH=499 /DNA_ID=CAMNT_0019136115 /DNA_START=10 /DNA_END=1509 /DNA_ORIENTATION=-
MSSFLSTGAGAVGNFLRRTPSREHLREAISRTSKDLVHEMIEMSPIVMVDEELPQADNAWDYDEEMQEDLGRFWNSVRVVRVAARKVIKSRAVKYTVRSLGVLVWVSLFAIIAIVFVRHKDWITLLMKKVDDLGLVGNLIAVALLSLMGFPFALGYTVIAVACGFLFDLFPGALTILTGVMCGFTLAFFSCRFFFRSFMARQIQKRPTFLALLKAVEKHQFKLTTLLRTSPIPFGIVNGLLAVSSIPYRICFVTTLIGETPKAFLMAWIGTKATDLKEIMNGEGEVSYSQVAILVIELTGLIVLLTLLFVVGRRAVQSAKQEEQAANVEEWTLLSDAEMACVEAQAGGDDVLEGLDEDNLSLDSPSSSRLLRSSSDGSLERLRPIAVLDDYNAIQAAFATKKGNRSVSATAAMKRSQSGDMGTRAAGGGSPNGPTPIFTDERNNCGGADAGEDLCGGLHSAATQAKKGLGGVTFSQEDAISEDFSPSLLGGKTDWDDWH